MQNDLSSMYKEQTDARLIDNFIIVFFIYRSCMFQRQRVSLREISLGYINVFMLSWCYF